MSKIQIYFTLSELSDPDRPISHRKLVTKVGLYWAHALHIHVLWSCLHV